MLEVSLWGLGLDVELARPQRSVFGAHHVTSDLGAPRHQPYMASDNSLSQILRIGQSLP